MSASTLKDSQVWLNAFYAMVAADMFRVFLGPHSVWIILAVGITGVVLQSRSRA